jgi:hypothetical protein
MSRSLPLQADQPAPADPMVPPDAPLQGSIAVYDPPMCCATGVCGPGVDPALLQLARDLRWLTAGGVSVQRHGIAQEPQQFVASGPVSELMRQHGESALPVTLVNGKVLAQGRYPSRDELLHALIDG